MSTYLTHDPEDMETGDLIVQLIDSKADLLEDHDSLSIRERGLCAENIERMRRELNLRIPTRHKEF